MTSNLAAEVADLLATSAEDRVYRQALRQLLPEGKVRGRPSGGLHNNVSTRFRDALRAFEREGWVARDDHTVVILDRAALWLYADQERQIPN